MHLCQDIIALFIPSCFGLPLHSSISNSVTNSEHSVTLKNITYGLQAGDLYPCDEPRKNPIVELTDCLSHTNIHYELLK